jgi:hypothetical protein
MIDITHYLKISYSQYNKGYPFLNCWGLVCEFYHREKGITLDTFSKNDLRNLNYCFISYRKELKEIQKTNNCMIGFFKAGILVHCGIYLDNDRVLHTDRVTRVQNLSEIVKQKTYTEVKFYDAL